MQHICVIYSVKVYLSLCILELNLFTLKIIQVPIQVNRHLVYRNGMRIVEPTKSAAPTVQSDIVLFTELDR